MRTMYFVPIVYLFLLATPVSLVAQSWTPLFDGQTLNGWVTEDGSPAKAAAWQAEDGTLHLDRGRGAGGNLFSAREYGDFELVFEWRVEERGNNGIKYRVRDYDGRRLGLEYQVIDDGALPNLRPKQRTASIYDLYEPLARDLLKPAGEFNRGRIVVRGNRLEHWLNEHLVTEAEVGSREWDGRVAQSKFSDIDAFGQNRRGRIMITDHGDEVWYRNIFIRRLACAAPQPQYVAGRCANGRRHAVARFRARGFWRRICP